MKVFLSFDRLDEKFATLMLCKKSMLKVIQFRKQIFLFSFEPKTQRNHCLISALASKKIFCWVLGSNENKKICFWNYLTFSGAAICQSALLGFLAIVVNYIASVAETSRSLLLQRWVILKTTLIRRGGPQNVILWQHLGWKMST